MTKAGNNMNTRISDIILKMLEESHGNLHDIEHFLKVYAYAKTIGEQEALDRDAQFVLEAASIVHDIACPLCREKYGKAEGHLQEIEGGPLTEDFLQCFALPEDIVQRITWLVSHHHTYSSIELMEHRILLEADFLVNASESSYSPEQIKAAKQSFFRTKAGIRLLDSIYNLE